MNNAVYNIRWFHTAKTFVLFDSWMGNILTSLRSISLRNNRQSFLQVHCNIHLNRSTNDTTWGILWLLSNFVITKTNCAQVNLSSNRMFILIYQILFFQKECLSWGGSKCRRIHVNKQNQSRIRRETFSQIFSTTQIANHNDVRSTNEQHQTISPH